MERKFFSVTEANRALPRIARLIQDLREKYRWLDSHQRPSEQTGDRLGEKFNVVNESPVEPEYFNALLRVRRGLKEIREVGAQVKDINSGLVDFPARLYGREVLLCWRLGEDEIQYWHDCDSGFSGRQPLPPAEREPGGGPGGEGQGN